MGWLEKLQLWHIRLTVAGVVITTGTLAVYWKWLPPEVPLFYSRPWGSDQLAGTVWLISIPVLSASVGVGAAVLAGSHGTDKLLKAMVLATSMAIQTVASLGLLRILTLVL